MKTLFSILVFSLTSFFVVAQESEAANVSSDTDTTSTNTHTTKADIDKGTTGRHKYFISTNSGVLKTPIGFRVGVLERMGGYIAVRFGNGNKYEEDTFNGMDVSEATLFAANAGLIFPVAIKKTFKVHTFWGIGYGKWFDRPSKNGQTVGLDFEGGLMFSYRKFLLNLGGNVLMGDGNSPKGDMTVGLGFRF